MAFTRGADYLALTFGNAWRLYAVDSPARVGFQEPVRSKTPFA